MTYETDRDELVFVLKIVKRLTEQLGRAENGPYFLQPDMDERCFHSVFSCKNLLAGAGRG